MVYNHAEKSDNSDRWSQRIILEISTPGDSAQGLSFSIFNEYKEKFCTSNIQ